jgi:hypothetical protein
MAIALSQSRHGRKKTEVNVENEILESLSISLEILVKILVRIVLETPQTVQ